MTKVDVVLNLLLGLAAAFGLVARLLPPGRAQRVFAFLGVLAAPKPAPPVLKPEEPAQTGPGPAGVQ